MGVRSEEVPDRKKERERERPSEITEVKKPQLCLGITKWFHLAGTYIA